MDADVKPDFGMKIPKFEISDFKQALEERGSSPKQRSVEDSGYRSFESTDSTVDRG